MNARVVIGVPLYGSSKHVNEALDTIAAQTLPGVAIVCVDDGNSEDARHLVDQYRSAGVDIWYERNERRLGLAANWQRAFQLALERQPDAEFFAWGSDHDAWHPRWAELLVGALDAEPDAVLAYPRQAAITAEGEPLREGGLFDTRTVGDPFERLGAVVEGMSAGNMVYGLYRVAALRAVGGFRRVLLPDRLLLTQLAARGTFVQVPEILWYRRKDEPVTLERQRAAIDPGTGAWWVRLPWWLQHAAVLAVRVPSPARNGGPGSTSAGRLRRKAVQLTLRYALRRRALHTRRTLRSWRRGPLASSRVGRKVASLGRGPGSRGA